MSGPISPSIAPKRPLKRPLVISFRATGFSRAGYTFLAAVL